GDESLAEVYFSTALERAPDHVDAQVGQALIALDAGDARKAIRLLESALALDVAHYQANMLYTEALLALGKIEAVEAHYLALRTIWPNDPIIAFNLAVFLQEDRKDLEHAATMFEALAAGNDVLAPIAAARLEQIHLIWEARALAADEQARMIEE